MPVAGSSPAVELEFKNVEQFQMISLMILSKGLWGLNAG